MSNQWHYLIDSKPQGPVSRTQLLALLQQNQIGLQTLIWQEGWPDWQPLERTSVVPTPPPVKLVGSVPPPPPPTYYPSSPPTAQFAAASQKKSGRSAPWIVAGLILAVLLGAGLQWFLQELLSGPELAANATSIHTSPTLESDS
ncbi:MAG: GYF domain-containing protein, partial [Planctomycetota bacterium]|nr:GYF domain-containing protein [Planctomycetota bacterium]